MKRITTSLIVLAALLASAGAHASPAEEATGRIIVKWRDPQVAATPAAVERVRELAQRTGRRLSAGRAIGGGMSVLQLDEVQQGATLAATLAALRAQPDVALAEPDRRVKIRAYTPSDPLFSAGLLNGGTLYERQWYLKAAQSSAIRADSAWDITRGGASPATSPVIVAVIDTGIRPNHPDLAGKLVPGYDFISNAAVANDGDVWDPDPTDTGDFLTQQELNSATFRDGKCGGGPDEDQPTDSSWHGTRVAGLIAANTDNALGMAGAGFNVRVQPVRALGKCGGFESDVIAAMYWAAGLTVPPPLLKSTSLPANATPANIINMSLGSDGACTDTYATAVADVVARGVLIVASAGNDGAAVGTPASCAGVLAVAGLRHVGTKVGYSNLGPEVGIAAPAGNCVLVGPNDPCLFALNTTTNLGRQEPTVDDYSTPTVQPTFGTSFSTPLAAGAAGLMKSVNPALTPAVLIARMKGAARPFPTSSDTVPAPPACQMPATGLVQGTECICNTQVCGAGMLDAHAAVLAAQRPVVLAQVTGTVGLGRTLTLDGAQSAASVGRTLVSYLWTVDSLSGGASSPVIGNANQSRASLLTPTVGTVVLRLTVTDSAGATDSGIVSITAPAGGSSSSSPPPSTSNASGGGGPVGVLGLLLAAGLLGARLRRARSASRPH